MKTESTGAERSDIEAAARAVASLRDPELIIRVLNCAKGGSERACEDVLATYYERLAARRGLSEIPVPASLRGDGDEAWRSSAWAARGSRGSERALDVRCPEVVRLLAVDAAKAQQEKRGHEARRDMARTVLTEANGRLGNFRREHGSLEAVKRERRGIRFKRVVIGCMETISSLGASAAFFGLTSLPVALITRGRVATALGIGAFLSLLVVWAVPALLARGLSHVSIGPRLTMMGLCTLVSGALLLAGGVACMRLVSSSPVGAMTASAFSVGGAALFLVSIVGVLILMAFAALLERDDGDLKRREDSIEAREGELIREIEQGRSNLEEVEADLRECEETIRREELVRAAFGQAIARAERIDEECSIDAKEGRTRGLDAYRHLLTLSVSAREAVHNRVILLVPEVGNA